MVSSRKDGLQITHRFNVGLENPQFISPVGTNDNPRYNTHMTSHIEKKKTPVFSRPAGAQRIMSLLPTVKTVG